MFATKDWVKNLLSKVLKKKLEDYAFKNQNVYSTEETVVGAWIDGKPLYRRVCTGSFALSSNTERGVYTLVGTSQASTWSLKKAYGVLNTASGQTHTVPSFDNTMSDDGYPASYNRHVTVNHNTSVYMTVREWSNCLTGTYEIILEYTKTTDTATIAIPTAAAMMAAYDEGVNQA